MIRKTTKIQKNKRPPLPAGNGGVFFIFLHIPIDFINHSYYDRDGIKTYFILKGVLIMEHRPAFKIFLVVFLILVVLCIAASLFTLFAVPENSGSDVSDIIPPIPDTGDSEHFISMVSSDGYVRITIYNEPVPADSENPWGYYYMHVWIDWLKTPISRMTDSLSIECPSFSLANSEEQYSVMTYTTTGLSGKRTAHQTEQGHNFYDWNLPNSTPLQRVSDIRIYARVKLYVTSPTIHQILQTYISYTHKKSLGGSNNSTYSLLSPMIEYIPDIEKAG